MLRGTKAKKAFWIRAPRPFDGEKYYEGKMLTFLANHFLIQNTSAIRPLKVYSLILASSVYVINN